MLNIRVTTTITQEESAVFTSEVTELTFKSVEPQVVKVAMEQSETVPKEHSTTFHQVYRQDPVVTSTIPIAETHEPFEQPNCELDQNKIGDKRSLYANSVQLLLHLFSQGSLLVQNYINLVFRQTSHTVQTEKLTQGPCTIMR